MTAKGVWGLAIAGLVGLVTLIGQPLADSVVKEGKLPDWLSLKLAEIAGWFSTDVPIPLWVLVLVVVLVLVCIGVAGTLLVKFPPPTNPNMGASLAATIQENTHRRCTELEEISSQLNESNISLHQQLQEKTQALEALQGDKLAVSDMGFKVLAVVARCRGTRITLPTIASAIPVGHVEARAAIDALVEQKLLHQFVDSRVLNYRFTSEGRQYYVKRMEQQKQG